jgi:hypothetical protein
MVLLSELVPRIVLLSRDWFHRYLAPITGFWDGLTLRSGSIDDLALTAWLMNNLALTTGSTDSLALKTGTTDDPILSKLVSQMMYI